MKTEIEKAKTEYKTADGAARIILENIFGKKIFENSNEWMDQWKEFLKENAKENDPEYQLPYPEPKSADQEWIDANFMMMHIIRKARAKKPDWNNSNEYKYTPWFDMRSASSGFGFSDSNTVYVYTHARVSSRLCIPKDDALMSKIAKKYLPIYEKIMTE